LAEKLTPEKDQVEEADRINVLQTLAESLMLQGNYHLATKKFTQAFISIYKNSLSTAFVDKF
jgi:hypothetical protein